MDCVDYKNTATNKDNVLKAFDFFSQIYCQKFEVGAIDDKAEERQDRTKGLGIYKMIDDIHDSTYVTPLKALKQFKHLRTEEYRYSEVTDVFWWVGFLLSCILGFFYAVGVYFTYLANP